jgi:hypothetical protein
MHKFFLIILFFSLNIKAQDIELFFSGPLANKCSFINNQSIIEATNQIQQNLENLHLQEQSCANILSNAKLYLGEISKTYHNEYTDFAMARNNKEVIMAKIARKIAEGTYDEKEFSNDLLKAEQDMASFKDEDTTSKKHLINALYQGSASLNALSANPQCHGELLESVLKPSITLLGQASGIAFPGSEMVTSGIVGEFSNFVGNLVQFIKSANSTTLKAINELIEAKNYYGFYKCAYKNINSIICDEREKISVNLNKLKEVKTKTKQYDQNGVFSEIRLIERQYPRIRKVLEELRDIYGSTQIIQDQLQITRIQGYLKRIKLVRPNPLEFVPETSTELTEFSWSRWTKEHETVISWNSWLMRIADEHIMGSSYSKSCKQMAESDPKYSFLWSDFQQQCNAKDFDLNDYDGKTAFIEKVVSKTLEQVLVELKILSDKIKEYAQIEGLFAMIVSQETINHSSYSNLTFTDLLNLYSKVLAKPQTLATLKYAKKMAIVIEELKTLMEAAYKGNMRADDEFTLQATKTFSAIAALTDDGQGVTLFVEKIDALFDPYVKETDKFFLYNKDKDLALKYVQFNYYDSLYQYFKKILGQETQSGVSNIPLAKTLQKAFVDVFQDNIEEKLEEDAKSAQVNDDYFKEASHACIIFYPMMENNRWGNKAKKHCEKIFKDKKLVKGLPFLNYSAADYSSNDFYFPLVQKDINYKNECYYTEFEEAQSTKKIWHYNNLFAD